MTDLYKLYFGFFYSIKKGELKLFKNLKKITSVFLAVVITVCSFATGFTASAAKITDIDLSQFGEYISNEELGECISYGGYITKGEYAKYLSNSVGAATYSPTFEFCYDSLGNNIKNEVGNNATMMSIEGHRAYCIEPSQPINASSTLSKVTSNGVWNSLSRNQQIAINTALCYGLEGNYAAISKGTTINVTQCYLATQVIIWELVNGLRNAVAPYKLNSDRYLMKYCNNGRNPNIKAAYNKIIKGMCSYEYVPSFSSRASSKAPTYTLKAIYNDVTKKWNYVSTTLNDSNGVLSTNFKASDFNKTVDVGNATVNIKVSGNKITLTPSKAKLNVQGKDVTVSSQKTGIPTTNQAKLTSYTSNVYQDIVSGGSIDPPNAYFKVQVLVEENGKLEHDGRIQKVVGTVKEEAESETDEIDGTLSTPENLSGWYFKVTASSTGAFKNYYNVDSFILGPTDESGFTEYISDYVKKHFNNYSNVPSIVPAENYYVTELGKWNGYSYYMPDFYQCSYAQSFHLTEGGKFEVSHVTNVFEIPTTIRKVNDDGSTAENYYFEAVNSETGHKYILRALKGGYVQCISDTSINQTIGKTGFYVLLPEGTYTLKELGLSDGNGGYYIPERFEKPADIEFEVSADEYKKAQEEGNKSITVTFENHCSGYIGVHKTDADDSNVNLKGAVFGVFTDENCMNLIYQLPPTDADGNAKSDVRFPCGENYYVKEIEAPPSYKLSNQVYPVTLEAKNVSEISYTVEASNEITSTVISKTDITGEKEVVGAHLNVAEKDNLSSAVDKWISTSEPHVIKGLVKGKSYVLTETIPAPGYVTANSITFTVNADGSVTNVTMKDDVTKIEIIKVNQDNQPLSGVKLQILEGTTGNNVVVPTWTTDGKPYRVDGNLIVGKKYRLHEVSAPSEYAIADDVVFEVKDTSEVQTIKMVNELNNGSVTLHKRDKDGANLSGSEWQIFSASDRQTALKLEKSGDGKYSLVKSGTIQTLSTDSNGDLLIEQLPLGVYYLVETKAPSGLLPYAKEIPFRVSKDKLNLEITATDNQAVMYNTGSIGITPFYIIGAIGLAAVIIAGGFYLILTKMKKTKTKVTNQIKE